MDKVFGLTQNVAENLLGSLYPEHKNCYVIDFADKCKGSFSTCDEFGNANWLCSPRMRFVFASKEVQEAFKGEVHIKHDDETGKPTYWAVVTFCT